MDVGIKSNGSIYQCQRGATQPTVLAFYAPMAPTKVRADASSYGLGAVLMQKQKDSSWRPIEYTSRSMSTTEMQYAQIEKEALSATCESFIMGKRFSIETDHKPLVCQKNLDSLPPTILRFRLCLARFDYTIAHIPGKELCVADTLSQHQLLK